MPKKMKSVVKKPMNGETPSYARNVEYKSVNERKKINSKEIFEMNSNKPADKKKKKKTPKGYHRMKDGSLMKGDKHPTTKSNVKTKKKSAY